VNIYVIYQGGIVISVTTLPRIVQEEFGKGADTVELWRNEQRVRTFQSAKEFVRFINPRPSEDDEIGGNDYEW
jgi:hypothetical protein